MHILCLVHDGIARVFALYAVDGDDDKLSKGTNFVSKSPRTPYLIIMIAHPYIKNFSA